VTPELQQRWQKGARPFDGMVVATCDEPELTAVLEMLLFAFERLRIESQDISVIADWHDHDGFLTQPTQTTWNEIATRLSHTESLYQSRNSDDYVRIALFPHSFEWLLRYHIQDSEQGYGEAWCDFDFSCTPESPSYNLIGQLHSKWSGYTDVSPAKQFFDNSYGG
jgi:hypothetical protein